MSEEPGKASPSPKAPDQVPPSPKPAPPPRIDPAIVGVVHKGSKPSTTKETRES